MYSMRENGKPRQEKNILELLKIGFTDLGIILYPKRPVLLVPYKSNVDSHKGPYEVWTFPLSKAPAGTNHQPQWHVTLQKIKKVPREL
jgi:hypothetical protein